MAREGGGICQHSDEPLARTVCFARKGRMVQQLLADVNGCREEVRGQCEGEG